MAPEHSAAASRAVSLLWECSTRCDLPAVELRDDRCVRAVLLFDSVPTGDSLCSLGNADSVLTGGSVLTADSSLADWAVHDSAEGSRSARLRRVDSPAAAHCHSQVCPKAVVSPGAAVRSQGEYVESPGVRRAGPDALPALVASPQRTPESAAELFWRSPDD